MNTRNQIEEQLRREGYRDRRGGIFEAPQGRRVVAIVDSGTDPSDWVARTNSILRSESFGSAPVWSRYVVVALDAPRSLALTAAAAAFCRDVAKCRRLVAFAGSTAADALPFLSLPTTHGGRGTPEANLLNEVQTVLGDTPLAEAFMDDQVSVARVQTLAEDSEHTQ